MRTLTRGVGALALALALSAAAALAADAPASPETRLTGVINVNSASAEQLEMLPGIGPSRARAIIEHRKEHGPYKEVADLEAVSGIGERALERIRPHCTTKGKTTAKLER